MLRKKEKKSESLSTWSPRYRFFIIHQRSMHVEKDIDISRDGYYLKVFGNFGEMI